MPSAKSRSSALAPAPTNSPGTSTARSRWWCTTPTPSTWRLSPSWGSVGGLLVLGLVGTLLWTGFSAWRAAAEPQRDRYAVLFAAMLAFAVGAAIDWFWEIAALGAVFFLAAGVLVSVRCSQLASPGPDLASETSQAQGGRYGLAVLGLAVAWIAAIALIGPLLVDHEIKSSQQAAAEENLASAVEHANTARSIEPWAASPYVQLGPARRAAGRIRRRRATSDAGDRTRGSQLAALLPSLQSQSARPVTGPAPGLTSNRRGS